MRRLLDTLLVALGALVLLWPAALSGRPPVFTDTAYYFTQGEYVLQLAHLLPPDQARVRPSDPTRLRMDGPDGRPAQSFTIMGARSPSYSLFLYLTQRVGSLWLTGYLQALAAAWTVWLLARGFGPRFPRRTFAGVIAVTAAGSALPFVAGFAMPDIFGAVVVGLAVAGLVWWERYGRAERIGGVALFATALTFHGSHPLDALAIAGAGGLLLWAFGAGRRSAAVRAGALAALGLLAIGFGFGSEALLAKAGGEPLRRPPFLAARMIADGPGRDVLDDACERNAHAYAMCAYDDQPLDNSEEILWSENPDLGAFSLSDYDTRLALIAEERRFVTEVVRTDPIGVTESSLKNWGLQILHAYVDDPLRNPAFFMRQKYWRRTSLPDLIWNADGCRARLGCPSALPFRPLMWVNAGLQIAGLLFVLARLGASGLPLARARGRLDWGDAETRAMAALAVLAAALLLNAGICGVLSGPFPRYQARVSWLIPAAAVLTEAMVRLRARERRAAAKAARRSSAPPLDLAPPAPVEPDLTEPDLAEPAEASPVAA